MKSRSSIMFDKSKSAMISAVEIINKPKFPYREEIFLILCSNAWELLIKAKWLKDNNNKISTLYVKIPKKKKDNSPSKKLEPKISRSGNPITHEILYLIKKMNEGSVVVDANIQRNIELILEARDCVIHFYTDDFMLNKRIREIGLASLENYIYLVREWFDVEVGEFGFSLLPVSVIDTSKSVKSQPSVQEQAFLSLINRYISEQSEDSDRKVSLEVDISIKRGTPSASIETVAIDPSSPIKVSISEVDIRKKYPWTNAILLKSLRKRYTNFIQDRNFNKLKKQMYSDTSFSHERKLDPNNPKSPKQRFYSPNCVQFFDKYYKKD